MSLIAELRRRNVFRVGAAYGIVAWLLLEVASVVLPALRLPEWTLTFLVFLVAAGFPLAMVLAWAFELTPEGIKRESVVNPDESITHRTGRKLDFIIIGALAVAVVYFAVDKFTRKGEPQQLEEATERVPEGAPLAREASIAVLPFANRSAKDEDAFFVDGMHDDILSHLAKIRSLKVISRTSVMEYRNTTKNLKTIGQELGAATVLEGGVQRSGNQIRINVQLIDAATDDHLWANVYDRQLTASNIFIIQTEIAMAIADALRATLSPQEQDRLNRVPTENLDAYEAYLLGRQRLASRNTGVFAAAVDDFQRAIRLDPNFALAYVGLAETYIMQLYYSGLPPDETLAKARVAVERALALSDQMGEAHNALAAIKQEAKDYAGAEVAFKRALELNPNHAPTYHWYGMMLRDDLGRPDEALALHRRANELDPLSGPIMANVAGDLVALGRFDEAKDQLARALKLAPNFAGSSESAARIDWFVSGRLDEAIVWYTRALSIDPGSIRGLSDLGLLYLDLGGPIEAEHWIRRSIELAPESFDANVAMQMLELYRGAETEALEHARTAITIRPQVSYHVDALELLRDHELEAGRSLDARALYETAHPELMLDQPGVDRRNYRAAIGLALVLSKTGDPQRVDRLLDRSLEVIQNIPRLGPYGYGFSDVQIYAIRGERKVALSALRRAIDEALRCNWWYYLKYDRTLDSLHDEPEYQAMVKELEADMATQLAHVREMERSGELEPIRQISATTR